MKAGKKIPSNLSLHDSGSDSGSEIMPRNRGAQNERNQLKLLVLLWLWTTGVSGLPHR